MFHRKKIYANNVVVSRMAQRWGGGAEPKSSRDSARLPLKVEKILLSNAVDHVRALVMRRIPVVNRCGPSLLRYVEFEGQVRSVVAVLTRTCSVAGACATEGFQEVEVSAR